MKRQFRTKYVAIFVLLIVMLVIYGYRQGWDYYITHPDIEPELAKQIREIEAINKQAETDPKGADARMDNLMQKMPTSSKLKRWYNLGFKAAVTDVVFHGKVVDQDDRPVSEARVSYFISGQFMAAGAGSGFTLTDEQGRFRIQGEGAKIVVQTITGTQIDYNTPTPEKVPYLSGGRNPELIIEDWDKYTSDDPYVFKAWRVEKYENVKKGYDGYSLLPDGRIYTYDPFDKDRGNRWHDGETNGLLRVSCERGEMAHGRDFRDWRITLTPVDGGIQLTDDIYMNIVPDNGYQPALFIEQQLSSPDYQRSVINQRYFFTAHHGKYYGGLFVHYTPHFRNDQCDIEISYKINLDGSHNLAVKPKEGWKP